MSSSATAASSDDVIRPVRASPASVVSSRATGYRNGDCHGEDTVYHAPEEQKIDENKKVNWRQC